MIENKTSKDKPKSINSLMKYMRNNKSIDVCGANHKKKLRYIGYYHGYKGYRFFYNPNKMLNYKTFDQLIAVYDFDMQTKAILYPQIMFLETAFKNYVLEEVLNYTNSCRFIDIYTNALTNYKNYKIGSKDYKKAISQRLKLRDKIYGTLSRGYDNKLIVQHFYHKDTTVPIWAIFELISLGDFGYFVKSLNNEIKLNVANSIGFNVSSSGADEKLTERIIFIIKDLRNAIAHNDTVYDTRFKASNPSQKISKYLTSVTKIENIKFNNIVDYVILVAYLMKCFGVSKSDIKLMIRKFTNNYETLRNNIPIDMFNTILPTDTRTKLTSFINWL